MPLQPEMKLISVDDHLIEHPNVWQDRLPEAYKEAGPRIVETETGQQLWQYEDRRSSNIGLNAVAGKDPSQFGDRSERRLDVALEIPKTHLAYKVSCCFLFHDPIAKAKNRPMADIAKKAGPALLRRKRLASHVCNHGGISPKRPGVGKIV